MMANTIDRYGLVTVVTHWITAATIFGLFGVGYYMVDLTYYDPLYQILPFIHKSIGILMALFLIVGLIWKWNSTSPRPVAGLSRFEIVASKIFHSAMYVLIGLIVISGYLISTAEGAGIDVFNLFSVPATIVSIPDQEDTAGLAHEYLAYLLIAIVFIHVAAALKHHFINKDNTLRRMLGMSLSDNR